MTYPTLYYLCFLHFVSGIALGMLLEQRYRRKREVRE